MNSVVNFNADEGCLRFEGELTVYSIGEATQAFRSAVDQGALSRVDLSGVTDLDTAGLQLLVLAKRISSSEGEGIKLVNHSEAVLRLVELAGLAQQLDAGESRL